MVIYYLESSLNLGGQEVKTLAEADALGKRGHSVTIVAQSDSKILRRAKEIGLRHRFLEMPNSLWPPALWRLKRWIHQDRVDILHAHSGKDAWIAGIAGRMPGRRPAIFRTRHITNPIKHRAAYRWLPDYLVVITRAMAERFVNEHGVDRTKVVLLPPAVNLRRFDSLPDRKSARRKLNLPENVFLIGMVAEFRGEKDHPTLIRAFKRVCAQVPDARLLLIGEEGTKGERIRNLVKNEGLNGAVEFLGFRNDVPLLIRALDVCVLTSTREPFGLVLLEAMAAGTPVISSKVEGPLEIVEDGKTGFLFDPGNDEQLAQLLIQLHRNPMLEMVSGASKWVRENHDFDKSIDRLEEVYRHAKTQEEGSHAKTQRR
jgi:glycosyltransferase involved in cell wall biosynthesis